MSYGISYADKTTTGKEAETTKQMTAETIMSVADTLNQSVERCLYSCEIMQNVLATG